jgi:MscS family membrane protein
MLPDWLPQPLLQPGPAGVLWWQWLALPALAGLILLVGRALAAATRTLVLHVSYRTSSKWDERFFERTASALTILWSVAAATVVIRWLALPPGVEAMVRSLLSAALLLAIFWTLWRSLDVLVEFLLEQPWAQGNRSLHSILQVARNLAKTLVAIMAVVSLLAAFGYPVATMLAGVGIGGIAVAFGAQRTIENLFGSIALATDQPFRVGDFVRVEGSEGVVEHIGIRSTRIRTLDRTTITIPNGKLAEMRIESLSARDRTRFATVIKLARGTSRDQVEQVLGGVGRVLEAHPGTWPDHVITRLVGLPPASLDIEVMSWVDTRDLRAFGEYRQHVLLEFMRVVEEAGTSFA